MGRMTLRKDEHVLGAPSSAELQLVVYGDYQCRFTARGMKLVREMHERLGERLLVVFRNFPLEHRHEHAAGAAAPAEAAHEQGRFWELHRTLFEHQRALDDEFLRSYARDVGLDLDRFDADRQSDAVRHRVAEDQRSGKALGVRSTPTFFLDGDKFDGAVDEITSRVEKRLAVADHGRETMTAGAG